jgi:hypothetical protein
MSVDPDVVVYGATGAGVTAAVAAANAGAVVRLVEPSRHIGGMLSGGLGWTDVGAASGAGRKAATKYWPGRCRGAAERQAAVCPSYITATRSPSVMASTWPWVT